MGDMGDKPPLKTTLLKTMLPMGVFVQKSSNGAVSARAGPAENC